MGWVHAEYFGVEVLLGKTLVDVAMNDEYDDKIIFTTEFGSKYEMAHVQDCCESVHIHEIVGDLKDLVGSPITMAEESTNSEDIYEEYDDYWDESHTWTFYKFATQKGYVTISWYGSSNGWYSEGVSFYRIKE